MQCLGGATKAGIMQAKSGKNVYLAQAKLIAIRWSNTEPVQAPVVTSKLRSSTRSDDLRPQANPGLGKVPSALHV